ncbi:MAG: exodeoxyribonuclease VII small subunit [Flavobacteriaceae bacterium]
MADSEGGKSGSDGDVASMSFEQAIGELESIVGRLEGGRVPLEESIRIYERGAALRARCETLLKNAEAKVEKITLSRDGTPTGTEPLDPD